MLVEFRPICVKSFSEDELLKPTNVHLNGLRIFALCSVCQGLVVTHTFILMHNLEHLMMKRKQKWVLLNVQGTSY